MTDPAVIAALRAEIRAEAGGFLYNPVFSSDTCLVCAKPVANSYRRCWECKEQRGAWGSQLADRVGSTTYARDGHQTHTVMRGYKSRSPQQQHQRVVQLLLADAIMSHVGCAERMARMRVTTWVTIPSLTSGRAYHPLQDLARPFTADMQEGQLAAAPNPVAQRKIVTPSNFIVQTNVDGQHVLVVDDTWTSGGQAQSAAAALKQRGAASVTIYTVARWLDLSKEPTKDLLEARKRMIPKVTFNPALCPFTHSACPR